MKSQLDKTVVDIREVAASAEKAVRAKRSARKSNSRKRAPKSEAATSRKPSKSARVLTLLKRPSGATLETLIKATGWQPHTVRAFVSAHVGKKLGLTVVSSNENGKRVYTVQK